MPGHGLALLIGAGPPLRASLVMRSCQKVGGYFRRLNAAPGTGLPPFGLPFAYGPAPW
ncbi:hypothetical protein CLV76_1118 [Marivita geojedonensis]|nr:hypothetical protein CLV76_1118 [Marivita geojedonensis]